MIAWRNKYRKKMGKEPSQNEVIFMQNRLKGDKK